MHSRSTRPSTYPHARTEVGWSVRQLALKGEVEGAREGELVGRAVDKGLLPQPPFFRCRSRCFHRHRGSCSLGLGGFVFSSFLGRCRRSRRPCAVPSSRSRQRHSSMPHRRSLGLRRGGGGRGGGGIVLPCRLGRMAPFAVWWWGRGEGVHG